MQKFKFKDNGVVIDAPTAIEKDFVKLGFKASLDKKAKCANTWQKRHSLEIITFKNYLTA